MKKQTDLTSFKLVVVRVITGWLIEHVLVPITTVGNTEGADEVQESQRCSKQLCWAK